MRGASDRRRSREVICAAGPDRVVWSLGPLLTLGAMAAGVCRLGVLMDNVLLDMNTEIGDGHRGAAWCSAAPTGTSSEQ